MIPKKIHYCWFGRNEYPEKVNYCLSTWKEVLPDYEFVLWNEDSFDLGCSLFAKQAYEAKRYAFVSDYVRVFALKHYGGIYLDTDIEVVRPFDDLLEKHMVLGTDDYGYLTAFMAAEPEHPYMCHLLEFYNGIQFLKDDGTQNTQVNNQWMQQMLTPYGYQQLNQFQDLEKGIVVYPCEFFHAKSLTSGKLMVSLKTYCIHHHTLLWVSKKVRVIRFLRIKILVPMFGEKKYIQVTNKIKKWIGK